MQYFISVVVGLLLGAVAGGLLGFLWQGTVKQEGWALVIGALGACAGAWWGGIRRTEGKLLFRPADLSRDPLFRDEPAE